MATPEQNVATLQGFFATALGERRPEEAVANYVGDRYIQHNPNVADGKDGFIDMVKNIPAEMSGFKAEPKLTIATEEYVVMLQHVSTPNDPTSGKALVDIIRFDDNGKIVEHWDVIADIPAASEFKHSNGYF